MSGDPIELVLAKQANDAIAQGADPEQVTQRLHDMVTHLRLNPDLAQGASDAISQGADPHAVAGRIYQLSQQGFSGAGAGREFGDEPTHENYLTYASGSFPFVSKATALSDAALDKVRGNAPGGFVQDYNRRFDAREAGREQYYQNNKGKAITAAIAGNLIPAIATLGGSLVEGEAPTAIEAATTAAKGLGSKIARGAFQGAGYGAIQGASEAHGSLEDYADKMEHNALWGGITGGAAVPAGAVAGSVLRKIGLPELLSQAADRVGLTRIANSLGTKGKAADVLAQRMESDANAGFVPPSPEPGVPFMAMDQGGPDVQGLAEGIASRSGPGRSKLIGAVTSRQNAIRPILNRAFDEGTGTNARQGEDLIRRIADEESNINTLTQINKEGAMPRPPMDNPLRAWEHLMGGNLENGVAAHEQLFANKNEIARRVFDAAREATKGQVIDSPTVEAIRKTPAGQIAFGWAEDQLGNRLRSPGELPDPEMLHFAKQRLAKIARMGVHDGQGGVLATQAEGALGLWGQIRKELPPIWRQADDATAAAYRLIDANNMGRDLMRTQLNPSGNKALRQSMDAVEQRFGKMSPEEQNAARVGMQSAFTDYLRSGNVSPKGLAAQLQEPTSAMARRIALATGDKDAPMRLAQSLGLQYQGQALPPIPAPSSENKAASLGLDVLRHETAPSGSKPSRSLAVLDRSKAAMSPIEQQNLQQGSAQAVRGAAAGSNAKTPSLIYGTPGSERARQVAFAFPDQNSASDFQRLVSRADQIQEQANRLLGNSRTATRNAENATASENTPALREAVRHPLRTIGTVLTGKETTAQRLAREKLDAALSDILTSPDFAALPEAQMIARFRRSLAAKTPALLPIAASGGATANR